MNNGISIHVLPDSHNTIFTVTYVYYTNKEMDIAIIFPKSITDNQCQLTFTIPSGGWGLGVGEGLQILSKCSRREYIILKMNGSLLILHHAQTPNLKIQSN